MHSSLNRVVLAATLAVTFVTAPHAATAAPHPIPIAVARHLALGTVVTVEGSVTVPSGVFASSFFDEGFAVQDLTGGIYVSMADNLGLRFRQQARVTGTLTDIGGLLVIVPLSDGAVSTHGSGLGVLPLPSRTGAIGEATEGRIVLIAGRITRLEDDGEFGQKVFVNDGSGEIRVFINTGAGISVAGLAPGQFVFVTGFSGQFIDYEIDPRFPTDLIRAF
ncbi:MAG TPA: hypothetical protein VGS07_22210 [Thermoanaerobaculia bacterium]|jgi:hypothetical protein|nr:hypothetical protein [Thermoanaerobaculia bacterium]